MKKEDIVIGKWVECEALIEQGYAPAGPSTCLRKMYRRKLKEPVTGQIIGVVYRREGEVVKNGTPNKFKWHQYKLAVNKTILLVKVAVSMRGNPIEVAFRDMVETKPLTKGLPWRKRKLKYDLNVAALI